ncbi:MAG: DUF4331 family protein [Gemmatirosa sp.]|nr:DUF4331 family protein [Gemmatirosa sp.]
MHRPTIRRATLVKAGAVALVATAVAAGVVVASDHQDTPFVEFNQRFDVNDVYAFPGATPDRIALVLGTSSPLTPASTPTAKFGDKSEVLYQLKVDNTGDGVEDLVFQITFTPGERNEQNVTVVGPVRPNQTGTANTLVGPNARTVTGRTNTVLGSSTGMQVFAGRRDDPFYIDLEQFFRILPDRKPESGPLSQLPSTPTANSFRAPGAAMDFVRGINDLAIVIELPVSQLTGGRDNGGPHPRFGIWGTTSKARVDVGTI